MRAVLILNLGTPDEPTARGLRSFYRHFFSDPYVFDIPVWGRWLLRNLIILPFRAPRTAKDYEKIWLPDGSPLKVYTDQLRDSLQQTLDPYGRRIIVALGMGYSKPFISTTMKQLEARGITELLVLPLFPQYSTATSESVIQGVKAAAASWDHNVQLKVIHNFYNRPAFIRAWTTLLRKHVSRDDQSRNIDHVVFSFHGLPEKNIRKSDSNDVCRLGNCCNTITDKNELCYRAQCMETARLLVAALGWQPDFYSVAFQSRFGRDAWIQPYLNEHLEKLASEGVRNVAVATPSFVSDCLETLHEIGIEYRDLFIRKGGENLFLIPNLNNEQYWFKAVADIVENYLEP